MSDIKIFEEVTTEIAIVELEEVGKKYEGLYVDMNNKDERKYVKDKASDINNLLKRLDRARIDKSAEYKRLVESEAATIKGRLQAANEPFTLLIDEHKAKRAKELAEKKAEEEAVEAFKQLQADHELALLMNDKFDSEFEQRELDKQKAEQERLEEIERQKEQAAEQARLAEVARQESAKRAEEAAQAKRESDIAHISGVRTLAKDALIKLGIDEELSKKVILAIHNNAIPNVKINY